MKHTGWKIYIFFGVAVILILAAMFAFATNEELSKAFSAGAFFAVMGGLFQLFREQLQAERELFKLSVQNSFALGVKNTWRKCTPR
jgi:hypothetical protein